MSLEIIAPTYRQTFRDEVTGLAPVHRVFIGSSNVAAAVLTTTLIAAVPPNTIREILNFSFTGTPGAAQTLDRINAVIGDVTGTGANDDTFLQWFPNPAVGAALNVRYFTPLHGILMKPNQFLTVNANFNAGVAANLMVASVRCMDYPLGNIQFG